MNSNTTTKPPVSRLPVMLLGLALAAAAAVAAGPGRAQAATNLILNPSFESGTQTPDNWHTGGYGTNTASFVYPAQGPGGPGDKAAQVSITNYTDGDAKWYFDNVPIQSQASYTFSDSYNSSATSYLMAQYTLANNSVVYSPLASLAPTNGAWASTTLEFTAPINAASVTIFHLLQSVGQLTVDDYSLTLSTPSDQNLFGSGMVSLTFDDGWTSQYANALPILKAAGMRGTFFIISNAMKQATAGTPNLLTDSNATPNIITTPGSVTWETFPDPLQNTYHFFDQYTAAATSTITATYKLSDNSVTSAVLMTLPPAPSGTSVSLTFAVPDNLATSTAILNVYGPPLHLIHSAASGNLSVQNPSLWEDNLYMTESQVLAMQAAGNEIGAHTVDHCDLVQLNNNPNSALTTACASPLATSTTAQTEINNSRTALLNAGAAPVTSFAYPYGSYNSSVETLVKNDNFAGARSVDGGYNTKASDKFALKNQIIDEALTTDPNGLTTVQSWVDTAIANKAWLILTLHQVDPLSQLTLGGETEGTTPEFFQQVVNYIKGKNVSVVTMGEGLQQMNATTTPPVTPTAPTGNPAPGTYAAPQSVTLTSQNATSIRYTTDGTTTPSCTTGTLYASAIPVTVTTLIKAVGCNNAIPSPVADLTYTINPPPTSIQIMPAVLPNGTAGAPYTQILTASTTSAGPFNWRLITGSLPAGLSFATSSTGNTAPISGTPLASSTAPFTIGVSNATASATQAYTLTINPAPSPTTTQLTVTVAVSGGIAAPQNFNLAVSSGAHDLYNGSATGTQSFILSLNSPFSVTESTTSASSNYTISYSGNCSGTPTNNTPLTCTITNAYQAPPPQTGSLTVIKNAIGGNGTFYFTGSSTIGSFQITTTSGTGSQTFNNLAPGTYGIIETPTSGWTQASTTCDSVTVTAGQATTCTITNTTSVPPPPAEITLLPVTLSNGTAGSPYAQTLAASTTLSGTFTWSLLSGSLPPGLVLNPSTASTTTISGTPSVSTTSVFTIKVANGTASTTRSYALTVAVGPQPPALAFTTAAVLDSQTVTPGNFLGITASASSNTGAAGIIFDIEIYSNTTGAKVMQKFMQWDFPSAATLSYYWSPPAPADPGTYTVKLGVFASNWSQLYAWNDNAASFTITGGGTPPSTPTFSDQVSLDNSSYNPGAQAAITTNVTATADAPNILIDTEVYDAAGNKISQNFAVTNLAANQQKALTWQYVVPNINGQYYVKVGIFSPDWSKLYLWDNNAASFQVGGTPSPPPASFVTLAALPQNSYGPSAQATLTTSVTSSVDVSNALIDTEIYDSSKNKVSQNFLTAGLTGGQPYMAPWNLALPAATGAYTIKIGVFSPGWGTLYSWNDSAGAFTIQ